MFKTVLTAVQDLDAAKATWGALLGEPTNDSPYYVGWTFDDHEIGLASSNRQGLFTDPAYWHTDDIEKSSAAIVGQQYQPSRRRRTSAAAAWSRWSPTPRATGSA